MSENANGKTEKSSKVIRWIWRGMKGSRLRVLFLVVLGILGSLCSLYDAVALKNMINHAVDGSKQGFWAWAMVLVSLIIIYTVIRALIRRLNELAKASIENSLKQRLFKTLLTKDYASVTAVHSGEWMNRITNDAVLVARDIVDIAPDAIATLVRLLGAAFLIIYYIRSVSWLIIPAVAIIVAVMVFLRRRLKAYHKKIQEADGRVRIFLSERLSNMMIVRSFSKEEQAEKQAAERMDEHLKARMERIRFVNICNIGVNALLKGIYVAAAVYCGYGILNGTVNYGVFAAVINLVGQLQAPLVNMSGYVPRWYAMIASAERLMEAESFEDDCPDGKRTHEEIRSFYDSDFTGIELKDICFTYERPAEWQDDQEKAGPARTIVMTGLDLSLRKCDFVAVTGPSGCGKSTLLKILMCFYPVDSGERLLRFRKPGCRPYDPETETAKLDASWRGLFAYVPQGNQLMSGSIRDVLTFGDRSVGDDALAEALTIACAWDFVRELPEGLATELGERGAGLSEGQMQRIAIARAIVSGNPILLLDEATSSLDEATEQDLLENLRTLTDRTVVIVTHRRRVLSVCDREVKMDEISA